MQNSGVHNARALLGKGGGQGDGGHNGPRELVELHPCLLSIGPLPDSSTADALANHAAKGLTKVHPEDNSGACNDAQLTSEDDAQVDMLSEREQMEITETTMPQAGSGMIGTV